MAQVHRIPHSLWQEGGDILRSSSPPWLITLIAKACISSLYFPALTYSIAFTTSLVVIKLGRVYNPLTIQNVEHMASIMQRRDVYLIALACTLAVSAIFPPLGCIFAGALGVFSACVYPSNQLRVNQFVEGQEIPPVGQGLF